MTPEQKDHRRAYHREWQKDRAEKVRSILIEFLGGCCRVCGYSKIPEALDFHHREPSEKIASISDLLLGNFERVVDEAQKCDLLCSNCHRELHTEEGTLGPHLRVTIN